MLRECKENLFRWVFTVIRGNVSNQIHHIVVLQFMGYITGNNRLSSFHHSCHFLHILDVVGSLINH